MVKKKEELVEAWYALQTISGLENVAKRNIELRIKSMNMEDYIFEVVSPEEVVIKKNKKGEVKEVKERICPGYLFIRMIATDEAWFIVRNTPNVTGFLGSSGKGAKAVPLQPEEMDPILKRCGVQKTSNFEGKVGDDVDVIAGSYIGHSGKIDSIDYDKEQVIIMIDMFGRPSPAEIEFKEIKLNK